MSIHDVETLTFEEFNQYAQTYFAAGRTDTDWKRLAGTIAPDDLTTRVFATCQYLFDGGSFKDALLTQIGFDLGQAWFSRTSAIGTGGAAGLISYITTVVNLFCLGVPESDRDGHLYECGASIESALVRGCRNGLQISAETIAGFAIADFRGATI